MKAEKSSIKLDEEGFNNLPPRRYVIASLNDILGKGNWEAVDGEDEYWKNEQDTLVIAYHPTPAEDNLLIGMKLAAYLAGLSADELYPTPGRDAGEILIRMWWD